VRETDLVLVEDDPRDHIAAFSPSSAQRRREDILRQGPLETEVDRAEDKRDVGTRGRRGWGGGGGGGGRGGGRTRPIFFFQPFTLSFLFFPRRLLRRAGDGAQKDDDLVGRGIGEHQEVVGGVAVMRGHEDRLELLKEGLVITSK
jgi:hypothetical protein